MSTQYNELIREYSRGWKPWQNESVLSHLFMPDGVGIRLHLKDPGFWRVLGLMMPGMNNPDEGDLRVRASAYDASYTYVTVNWRNNITLHIETATQGDDLVMLVSPEFVKTLPRPLSLIISGVVAWGREGYAMKQGDTLLLHGASGDIPVYMTAPAFTEYFAKMTTPYIAAQLSGEIGISTGKRRSLDEIKAIIAGGREALFASHAKYGEYAEAYNAMQNAIFWSTIYAPDTDQPVSPVSRIWTDSDSAGYLLFCWDTYFAAMMAGLDNKALSYANAVAITRSIRECGFVPNIYGPTGHCSYDRSQPPVGSMVCLWLYHRYGDKWFLSNVYDDLKTWNTWFFEHRRNETGNLTWGSCGRYDPVTGSFVVENMDIDTTQSAAYESGLDNTPMYDDVKYNPKKHLLELDDVGLTGLFIHDCLCLAEIARILGKDEDAQLFEERAASTEDALETLWDEEIGMYLNRRLDTGAFDHILTPFHFHALFSRRSKGAHAERMVREHLLNPEEFWGEYVLPSVARNHPSYKDNNYWRGPIWGPMNMLVYMALREHGMEEVRRELAKKCNALVLKEWLENRNIHENYNADTAVGQSTCFYHWGALNSLIPLIEHEEGNL